MELREFSEIILFNGKEIGGKLVTPQFFTDELPGSAIIAPKFPSRPSNLIFTEGHTNQKVSFPNIPELEKEMGRGVLLHFFANHELLALELMALFLLKFLFFFDFECHY